jgi:hypothetical protein
MKEGCLAGASWFLRKLERCEKKKKMKKTKKNEERKRSEDQANTIE